MTSLSNWGRPSRRTFGMGTALATAGGMYNQMTSGQRRVAYNGGQYVLSRTGSAIRSLSNSAIRSMKSSKSARSLRTARRRTARAAVGAQLPSGIGGESKSYFTLRKPKNKGEVTLKMLGTNTVNRSSGFSTSSTQGVQTARNLNAAFNSTDVINAFTTLGQSATAYNAAKILLLNYHSKALITNAETTHAHFTIYDLLAKEDGGALNTDPQTTFLAGCADASGGASGDATVPGTTPWNNPRFREAYKVLQSTEVILCTGQTHTHNVSYSPNYLYNHERDIISGVGAGPIGQLTVWTMIIQHGTPVHGVAALTSVTLGASKLDVVLMESFEYKCSLFNNPVNSISTTLVTNLTGEQENDQTIVDTADAAP